MRVLLALTLAVVGAAAAPLNTEVDIVPPRRVNTGGDSSLVPYSPRRINIRDILRRMGLGDISGLVPHSNPNCDSARFQLTDAVYDVVIECQREHGEGNELKSCIIEALPEEANDLKEFLNRDSYNIDGISTSFSILLVDGEFSRQRTVRFRVCPDEEQNTVEETEAPQQGSDGTRGTPVFGLQPPMFQLPDIFSSQRNPFFDLDSIFKPFFRQPGSLFPTFPNFDGNLPDDADYGNCVTQSFELSKELFDMAKNCRYGDDPFKQCLQEEMADSEDGKELLRFVEDEDHTIVGTRFYSSISVINGEESRKHKLQLQRCLKSEETDGTEEAVDTAAEPEVPAGQAGQAGQAGPELLNPAETQRQETYGGAEGVVEP